MAEQPYFTHHPKKQHNHQKKEHRMRINGNYPNKQQ